MIRTVCDHFDSLQDAEAYLENNGWSWVTSDRLMWVSEVNRAFISLQPDGSCNVEYV